MEVVVLCGGGLDSNFVMAMGHRLGWTMHVLFVYYGQASSGMEWAAVKAMAKEFDALDPVEISLHIPWLQNNAMVKGDQRPDEDGSHASLIVPQRNVIFLSIAASYAEQHGIKYILTGFDDGGVAPDTNQEMMTNLEHSFWCAGMENKPKILAPVKMYSSKRDLYDQIKEWGYPTNQFYSCYAGAKQPCMKCSHCLDYAEALGDDYLARS